MKIIASPECPYRLRGEKKHFVAVVPRRNILETRDQNSSVPLFKKEHFIHSNFVQKVRKRQTGSEISIRRH